MGATDGGTVTTKVYGAGARGDRPCGVGPILRYRDGADQRQRPRGLVDLHIWKTAGSTGGAAGESLIPGAVDQNGCGSSIGFTDGDADGNVPLGGNRTGIEKNRGGCGVIEGQRPTDRQRGTCGDRPGAIDAAAGIERDVV